MPRPGRASDAVPPAGGATTIRDVARRASVSVATVSRVLNASAPVSEPTRRRILDAARELRFTPNASARSLSTRRTAALGVILPDLHGEFFSELLRGIDQGAQRADRHLLVSSSHHDSHGIAVALRAMHGRVDGLIVMAPDVPAHGLAQALPSTLPVVLLNCATPADATADIHTLSVDNHGGARAMVRHLASIGHREIAFVDGPAQNADATARRRGYLDAMAELGLPVRTAFQPSGDFTAESGWEATRALLGNSPHPTAIFAANDMMAIGALHALREHGVSVPGDVAVVGFDDIPTARHVNPPLTTVRADAEALGTRAAMLLATRLASGAAADRHATSTPHPRREVLPTTLVIRSSCGSAAIVSTVPAPDLAPDPGARGATPSHPSPVAGPYPATATVTSRETLS